MYLEEFSYCDDFLQHGIEIGEEKKSIKVARNLIRFGLPYEKIAEATDLDIANVREIASEVV